MPSTCLYAVSCYIYLLAMNTIPFCRISGVRASAEESCLILAPDNMLPFAAIKRFDPAITRQIDSGLCL